MNIIAVVSGVVAGLLVTLISQHLLGSGATTIGGALVAASISASAITRAMK